VRNALCQALLRHAGDPQFVFLTGDLGFQALEPLRAAAGPRFINAGVAEQNMVSAAAGLAWCGLKPWVYSIASFLFARPFEQIRNDLCAHDLGVTLIGNGGGYGYGVMGHTHHALNDYGSLLGLDHLHVYVPAFAADLPAIVDRLSRFPHPAYLRLGRCELPVGEVPPPYAAWRALVTGPGPALVIVGPLAAGIARAVRRLPENRRPNLWVLAELPLAADTIPPPFLQQLDDSGHLMVIEEHVAHGGAGQALLHVLGTSGRLPRRFTHRHALGYVSGCLGTQAFHRRECGLDAESIVAELEK
jgi:transketolase